MLCLRYLVLVSVLDLLWFDFMVFRPGAYCLVVWFGYFVAVCLFAEFGLV